MSRLVLHSITEISHPCEFTFELIRSYDYDDSLFVELQVKTKFILYDPLCLEYAKLSIV